MEEMNKLEQYLKKHEYNYTRKPMFGSGVQIIVYSDAGARLWDAVWHFGSYGNEAGKLEIMGTIVPEDYGDDVMGWLSAEDIIGMLETA